MSSREVHSLRALTIAFIASAALIDAGCGKKSDATPQAAAPLPVEVEEAHAVPVSDTSDYVATLKSRNSAVIMPQVEGQIVQIAVHSGDQVAPGTLLMQIDPLKQQATVKSQEDTRAAAEANLKFAQQQYERASGLFSAGVVSKQELDQTRSGLDNAKAQVQALDASVREQQVQLHYYSVTAPWDGIVGDIPVHVGDRVTTTTQLTTVDKPGSLEVYVYVPIERASQLKMDMPVDVLDGSGNVIATSRVSFISPQVDSSTQTILVKARIANNKDKLRQSQFIRARVIWGMQKSPVVPVLAVSRVGGQYFAFVAEKSDKGFVARQKPLKVGQMVGNDYVVLDGVKPGDKVIVSGTQFLVDGAPVTPQGS
ncbi:MAG TPA: efflux RND transporter periplasmic adaptor subunit [Terriglobales bacterium]|nr:efflux RND transporter periplasmic adaptor subunit [Terriglobales bacterium]